MNDDAIATMIAHHDWNTLADMCDKDERTIERIADTMAELNGITRWPDIALWHIAFDAWQDVGFANHLGDDTPSPGEIRGFANAYRSNALDMLMIVNEAGGHLTCASDHAYEHLMNGQTA